MESGIKYHNPQPPIFITAIRCFIKCVEYYFCNKKYRKLPKHLPKTTKTPTENHQNTYRKPPKHLPKIALAIYPLFRQTYVTNFCQTNLWLYVHFTMVKSSQGYLCYTLLCIDLFNVRNIN